MQKMQVGNALIQKYAGATVIFFSEGCFAYLFLTVFQGLLSKLKKGFKKLEKCIVWHFYFITLAY